MDRGHKINLLTPEKWDKLQIAEIWLYVKYVKTTFILLTLETVSRCIKLF